MTDRPSCEGVVVGGGPVGMTTALYTTWLGHRTAVFEAAGGRHAAVARVHNLFGVAEDVSGEALAEHAVAQFEEYGGRYFFDENFETSVEGAYAAGHVTNGRNRTVVALGDGAKAGIAIDKDLGRFPLSPAELEDGETVDGEAIPAAPAELRAKMRLVRNRDSHAGLRGPPPDR